MKFDFPIDRVEYSFECIGDCQVNVILNGLHIVENVISGDLLKERNILKISFSKSSPGDTNSYALLRQFKVNGGDFLDDVKILNYKIDKSKHRDAPDEIRNNLYFGYIGTMEIALEQTNDKLKKAAWIIADKEFKKINYPLRENIYRTKNFSTVYRDAKYMFTGCHSPFIQEISREIDSMLLESLRLPLRLPEDRKMLEQWINDSKRIKLSGLDAFDSFSPANGVTDCLWNFMARDNIFMPKKMYYLDREMLGEKHKHIKDAFTDKLEEDSNVIFEYPSPWYTNKKIEDKISEAKSVGCYIALDLTWLPVSIDNINIDLNGISEVYLSMNKTWPLQDVRPAFRWCRTKQKDDLDLQMEHGLYTKINPQIFMNLIKKFSIDYVYDTYKKSVDKICNDFNLDKTNILWFTKRDDILHDTKGLISDHYYLDEFVCVVNLLQHKDKYFW